MYNGIGGMPAAPIDLLLGFIGSRPSQGSSGPGDFGQLLGLMGSTPETSFGVENGLTIPELPFTTKPDPASAEAITLFLPQELAWALGLNGQPASGSQGQAEMTDNTGSMVKVSAELLSTDDGNDQTLYLKIIPDNIEPETGQLISGVDGNEEEMILPMRLRTVEQDGNRIIAEAELQTATGKDASIRLRLELAGNLNRIQETRVQTLVDNQAVTAVKTGKNEPSLSRLFHDLDVKSMVIEEIADDAGMSSKDALPRMASTLRPFTNLRMASKSPEMINRAIGTADAGGETFGLSSDKSTARTITTAGFDADGDMAGTKSDGNSATVNNLSASTKGGVESNQSGTTTIPVSELGNTATSAGAKSEPGQVRFYDIDQKLDQLKQNPGQKITIQLTPAQLGKMDLSISSHRGVVTVSLAVDSIQAKQAVERNLAKLESHLSASGIRVDNFQLQVNQSSKNASYSAYQQQYDQQSGSDRRGSRNYAQDRRRLQQFSLPEVGFRQTLVNCLA